MEYQKIVHRLNTAPDIIPGFKSKNGQKFMINLVELTKQASK